MSISAIKVVSVPIVKEKKMTPVNIAKIEIIYSNILLEGISPYPTVIIV